jgi:hypothetical protein
MHALYTLQTLLMYRSILCCTIFQRSRSDLSALLRFQSQCQQIDNKSQHGSCLLGFCFWVLTGYSSVTNRTRSPIRAKKIQFWASGPSCRPSEIRVQIGVIIGQPVRHGPQAPRQLNRLFPAWTRDAALAAVTVTVTQVESRSDSDGGMQ